MNETAMSTDQAEVMELHRAFITANKTAHHPFLEEHVVPGPSLVWYNLNQSNYFGQDHIVELWKMLATVKPEGEAKCDPRDEKVTASGDMALVTYLLDFAADFGALGKAVQEARNTEVWQRFDGDWKMVHFHSSNYVPGVMGGK